QALYKLTFGRRFFGKVTLFETFKFIGFLIILSYYIIIVLFPLLDRVQTLSTNASTEKIQDVSRSMGLTGMGVSANSDQIMLHHSRNTAQKQWSETQVLTLAGVCRVFYERRIELLQIECN